MDNTALPAVAGLEAPVTDTPQPRSLRKFTLRAIDHDTPIASLVGAYIAGLDDESPLLEGDDPEASYPLWQPQTADDVDKLTAAQQTQIEHWQAYIARAQAQLALHQQRQARILELYADRIAVVAPVPEGGAYKTWKGPWTLGTYRNQHKRAAQYRLTNKDAARAAGLIRTREVQELETAGAINAWREEHGMAEPPGVAVSVPPPVSFSPPKVAAE